MKVVNTAIQEKINPQTQVTLKLTREGMTAIVDHRSVEL